jgi:predicted ATPase
MLLSDRPNSSQLKSFSINGLFGFKDVEIPFDKEAVILIAENGSGKTTILNILYYSISCKFHKLSTLEFESVILKFASGVSVEIEKRDLNSVYNLDISEIVSLLDLPRSYVFNREIEMLQRDLKKTSSSQLGRRRLLERIHRYDLPVTGKSINKLIETWSLIFNDEKEIEIKSKIDKLRATIQKNLNESVFYFPTYRRIEEDLKNLGYEDDRFERLNLGEGEGKLIQFGMDDVIDKLNEIKSTIKNSALNLFSKVTGEILTQLAENIEITQEMRDIIQPDTLKIVLSRVGEKNISKSDRETIERLVSSGEINNGQYEQLVYFLSKLVGLYEQQKEKDDSINQFANICNEYLNKKRIIYDEANVDISIIQTRNNSPIDIRNLSSGEKQIISLFSKIYLESSEDFILLFDEPELSLSLEWQKLLLPDILKSGRCKLLLAVTHSPFIFDNELDLNANDLDNFVKEK